MGQVHRLPECVTLNDWRQLTNGLARNLTDAPVGTWTAAKRDEGARASDLHTDHGEIPLKVDPKLERSGPRGGVDSKRMARSRARKAAMSHGEAPNSRANSPQVLPAPPNTETAPK